MPQPYDGFAPYFDAWQHAFGPAYDDLILPRIVTALASGERPVRRVVDLGIGTGDLVVALARRGLTVVGVDRSAPMLAIARAKAAAAGLDPMPTFLEQDVRDLSVVPPADAAVCVYTVVNQLTGDGDLARAFAAVRAALVAGGLFVFEVNLPSAYARHWTGTEAIELPDAVVTRVHHAVAGEQTIAAEVAIRERGSERVIRDHILQRYYDDGAVRTTLAGAGFAVRHVERFDPFGEAGEPQKALWIARRT